MVSNTRSARILRREARADLYFALYASLGANRSLAAVSEVAGAAGVPVEKGAE